MDNQIQSHNSTDNMIHNNLQHVTATETQEPNNSLRKDKIIQFKYNNDNNWNAVTLVKRAVKRTGITQMHGTENFKIILLSQ